MIIIVLFKNNLNYLIKNKQKQNITFIKHSEGTFDKHRKGTCNFTYYCNIQK